MSDKKRTITPEHLAKMQAGKQAAKQHRERIAAAEEMSKRVVSNQGYDREYGVDRRSRRRYMRDMMRK